MTTDCLKWYINVTEGSLFVNKDLVEQLSALNNYCLATGSSSGFSSYWRAIYGQHLV